MHFFQDALTLKIQVFRERYAESTSKQQSMVPSAVQTLSSQSSNPEWQYMMC